MKTVLRKIVQSAIFPLIVLALASTGFVASEVVSHDQISPFDEYVYLDYLAKVPTQGIVRSGDETGEVARNEISCRGVLNYGAYGEGCNSGSHDDDATYPYNGRTGADIYAPLYFGITWAVAQPLTWLGIGLLDAGRLVGALWLSLGTMGVFLLLRLLRVNRMVALGLSLGVIATPAVLWATTYVSTDAPTLAVAAGMGCLAVCVARRRINIAWLPSVGILAVLFKVQNLAAVGVAAAAIVFFVLLESLRVRRQRSVGRMAVGVLRDNRVIAAIASVLLGVAAQAAWMSVRAWATIRGEEAAVVDSIRLPLSATGLVNEAFRFFQAVGATDAAPGAVGALAVGVLSFLAIAAVVGILAEAKSHPSSHIAVALATLLCGLLMGPALAVAVTGTVGFYFPLPVRYGLVLLPSFILTIGLFLSRFTRIGPWLVLSSGALAAVATIVVR